MRDIHEMRETVREAIEDFAKEHHCQTDRDTVQDELFTAVDDLFGREVQHGRIDQYGVSDMVATAADCAVIIALAEEDSWVADDSGLWDGMTYGVLAAIAFHSLANLFHSGLDALGFDTNDDFPFASKLDVSSMNRDDCVEALESIDIECEDTETVEELRDAVEANVLDGTLDAEYVDQFDGVTID